MCSSWPCSALPVAMNASAIGSGLPRDLERDPTRTHNALLTLLPRARSGTRAGAQEDRRQPEAALGSFTIAAAALARDAADRVALQECARIDRADG